MDKNCYDLRNAIFSLHTRRFGTVSEIMIKKLLSYGPSKNQFHDLYDKSNNLRVEVKFSRAQKKEDTITDENIKKQLEKITSFENRMFPSSDWKHHKFDCNIQQVKSTEFDILFYGIFFADVVMIFRLLPENLNSEINFSDKQHKGNLGEGQFHLNNLTYEKHLQHYFHKKLSYCELNEVISTITTDSKIKIIK
ncbi:hypothetical protein [Salisediminibacterium selenitireducens]|uniref:Uncharacterized protein n=1 Tax=Bacillus selenitireducens (strain ATCC 700615 / DSM 15326 / MLS10) TaxID=439292 RepID=D6XZV4_BACIE|nr:hypothetical protein [Salisediminibacterium selenitireducens]ADI00456.1 hypothetical protein Bsel_2971 [[Bacillus] selenitireducens MLS10]